MYNVCPVGENLTVFMSHWINLNSRVEEIFYRRGLLVQRFSCYSLLNMFQHILIKSSVFEIFSC